MERSTYLVVYRYEGVIEIKATNQADAQEQAEALKEQRLYMSLGDVEMESPVLKAEFNRRGCGVLSELRSGREA